MNGSDLRDRASVLNDLTLQTYSQVMADRTPPADDEPSGLASRLPVDRTLLTPGERASLAARLPAWEIDGDHLRRTFGFVDFSEAWAFMGRVAVVAEALQHHPDWSNSWNQVEIAVTTHSAGGLTGLDVTFAEAVDGLA